MTELIIVGDEAWLPEEWEAAERRREFERERYRRNPRRREQVKAAVARWRARNPGYGRRMERARRAAQPHVIGSLHSLACTGPTRATGCRCWENGTRKIRCYDKPVEEAA